MNFIQYLLDVKKFGHKDAVEIYDLCLISIREQSEAIPQFHSKGDYMEVAERVHKLRAVLRTLDQTSITYQIDEFERKVFKESNFDQELFTAIFQTFIDLKIKMEADHADFYKRNPSVAMKSN